MSIQEQQSTLIRLTQELGKDALHALYPNDFEVYLTALELVDSAEQTAEYFLFPLNPSEISMMMPTFNNVKKTLGGVSTISTQTFTPFDISIRGNFGRKFKFIIGQELINLAAFNFSELANSFNPVSNFKAGVFSNIVKNGYGCTKILERIINKSLQLDKYENPYSLYFYNLSFGQSLLVKIINFTPSQTQDRNMIWSYDLRLKAIANLKEITKKSNQLSVAKTLGISFVQNAGNSALNNALSLLQ